MLCTRVSFSQTMPTPCPEGQYRDYSNDPAECRYLDFPQYGAQISIPSNTRTLSTGECNREALNNAIQDVAASGGGRILVPACSIEIRIPIFLPSNVEVRGSGAGKTVLYAHADNVDRIVAVKRRTNVVLADMTIDGYDRPQHNLEVRYARNVVLEGLEVKRAAGSAIDFYQSRNVTIRYSLVHDVDVLGSKHGIGSKDCYLGRGDTDSSRCANSLRSQAESDFNKPPDCNTSYCPCTMSDFGEGTSYCFGYGSLWTQNYAVYSNFIRNIRYEFCTAIHARNGELAGNICESSGQGSKMPDAWDVNVHNNLYRNNVGGGVFTYGPIKGIHPRRIRVYANTFVQNGDVPVRAEGPEGLFLIDNKYEGNCAISSTGYCQFGGDYIVNTYEQFADGSSRQAETYICSGFTQEDVLRSEGFFGPTAPGYADTGTCYSALPVELVEFGASSNAARDVRLRWSTASETHNAGFEIEHSVSEAVGDNDRWTPWQSIGFVTGAGTETEERNYSYSVPDMAPGIHRFRLKQVDLDGVATLSPAVEVTVDVPNGFRFASFYPNPFNPRSSASITVSESQNLRVDVYDVAGRHVARLFDGQVDAHRPTRVLFNGAGLPSGTYVVRAEGLRTRASQVVTLSK